MGLALITGNACSSRLHTASGARDGGSQPDDPAARLDDDDRAREPEADAVDDSSDVACEVVPGTDAAPIAITSGGLDGHPWLNAGRDVSVHEAGVVTALEELKLSVTLPTTGRTLDVEGADFGSLAVAVGDSVGIILHSNAGHFGGGAQFLIVRSSLDGPPLFAWYAGDRSLLGGAFSGALGIDIQSGREALCSFVPDFTCFDGQRTSVLQLTLAGDEPLTLASGDNAQLFIGEQSYDVAVTALRIDEGPSERCFDAVFGDFFGVVLTRR
jgi:hypothetical protein